MLTDELLATPVQSHPVPSAAPIAPPVEPAPPKAVAVEPPEDSATELEAALRFTLHKAIS